MNNINANDIPIHAHSSDLSESEVSLDDSNTKINNKSKSKDVSISIKSKKNKNEEIECSSLSSISEKSSFSIFGEKNDDIGEIIKILVEEKEKENQEIDEILKTFTKNGKKIVKLKLIN